MQCKPNIFISFYLFRLQILGGIANKKIEKEFILHIIQELKQKDVNADELLPFLLGCINQLEAKNEIFLSLVEQKLLFFPAN